MNAYVFLGGAIALEVAATTAMKSSDGFTKLVPSVICAIGGSVAKIGGSQR